MNINCKFFYFLFHFLLIQGEIAYVDSLNQTANKLQETFYENFYHFDLITEIRISTDNMTFILNETSNMKKDLSIISKGMNNSLIIENSSILIENTFFELRGFTLKLRNFNNENSSFMLSRNGSLILEDLSFEFTLDFPKFSVFSIQNSVASLINLKLSKSQPNFNYFVYSSGSDLNIVDLLLENNDFIDTKFLNGSDCQIKLQNISISKNIISNQFIYLEQKNEKINASFSQIFMKENIINSTFMMLKNLNCVTLNNSIFETNFVETFNYFSNLAIVQIYNITYWQNVFYYDQILGGVLDITNSSVLLLNYVSIIECFSNTSKTIGINANQINFLTIEESSFLRNSVLIPITNNSFQNLQINVILNLNIANFVKLSKSLFKENYLINDNSWTEDHFIGTTCAIISGLNIDLEIFESTFENNLSSDNSLCLILTINSLFINRTSFRNNSASSIDSLQKPTMRGVIYTDFMNLTILNSVFSENKANVGSCIMFTNKNSFSLQNIFIFNSQFIKNYAFNAANTIMVFGNECERLMKARNSSFLYGQSDGLSGVFFFGTKSSGNNQNYSFYFCDFSKNSAFSFGAILEHYPSSPNNCFLYFECCSFEDNFLNDFSDSDQGIVFDVWGEALGKLNDKNYIISTKNCFFSGHQTFSASVISGNRAIFYDDGSTFQNNEAFNDGGSILLTKSIMILTNSLIINSHSLLEGGFISVKETSTVYLNNIMARNCSSKNGGFANVGFLSNFQLNNSNISGCTANFGALLFMTIGYSSKAVINNCDFSKNTATDSFQISIVDSNFSMSNVYFINSSEIMLLSNTFVTLNNITARNITCKQKLNGCFGAFTDQTSIVILNVEIENMLSLGDGGIFYVYFSNFQCQIMRGNKINNEGVGSILLSITSNIDISTSFYENFKNDGIKLVHSNFTIRNSNFNNFGVNSFLKSSVIFFENCPNIFIVNCTFSNLFSSQNGTCLYFSGSTKPVKYEITKSTFLNNTSVLSGASIYHNKVEMGTISQCTFEFQNAKIGSVLVFDCSNSKMEFCVLILISNKFRSNYASYEGGVMKWNYKSPQNLSSNIFVNNTAKIYGNNFANIPIRFGVNIYQNNNTLIDYFQNKTYLIDGMILNDSKSGYVLPYQIELFLLDSYNKIYNGSTESLMKVDLLVNFGNNFENSKFGFLSQLDPIEPYIYGTTSVQIVNGKFVFDKISIVGTPNTTIFLSFYTTSVDFFYSDLLGYVYPNEFSNNFLPNSPYIYVIPFQIAYCSMGETYDSKKRICQECPNGKYNFDLNVTDCYDCFPNAICLGGSKIIVRPGFWRSNYFSTNVYQCDGNLDNCPGGIGPECSANYQGRLCEQCGPDENGQPTAKNVFGECIPCNFSQYTFWLNIGFVIFSSISYVVLLILFLKENNANVDYEYNKVIFRIIINYFQDLYFYPIRHNPLSQKSELFKWVNRNFFGVSEKMFSFDCFYVNFGFGGSSTVSFPSAFNRLAFFMMFFFIFLLVHSFFWTLLFRKKRSALRLKSELILNLLILIYLFYPALSLKSVKPFNCINIDGIYYVQSNLASQCWNFNHYVGILILCVPNVVLWTFILPMKVVLPNVEKTVLYFSQSVSKRLITRRSIRSIRIDDSPSNNLETPPSFAEKLNIFNPNCNIFYVGYKMEYYDWVKYEIVKNIYLVYCSGLFENEPRRLFFGALVYFLNLLLVIKKQPYKMPDLNFVECFHCAIFIFSYFILILVTVNQSLNYEKLLVALFIIFHTSFLIFAFQKMIIKLWRNHVIVTVKDNVKPNTWRSFVGLKKKIQKNVK